MFGTFNDLGDSDIPVYFRPITQSTRDHVNFGVVRHTLDRNFCGEVNMMFDLFAEADALMQKFHTAAKYEPGDEFFYHQASSYMQSVLVHLRLEERFMKPGLSVQFRIICNKRLHSKAMIEAGQLALVLHAQNSRAAKSHHLSLAFLYKPEVPT